MTGAEGTEVVPAGSNQEVCKATVLIGANGSGKSNFIRSSKCCA